MWCFEVRRIVVGRIGVHEECSACWDSGVVVGYGFYANAGKTDWNDGEETEDFAYEGGNVRDLFFLNALCPCIAVWVDGGNFVIGAFLEFLAM